MRIAVLGAGTAGYLTAAHISRFFPQAELVHIFDSRISPIGVGEGTLPAFKTWLEAVTGASLSQLAEACQATKKMGVFFEGWGATNPTFHHYFVGDRHAYHLSAARLPRLLEPHIHATQIDKHVSHLHSTGRQVEVRFSDGSHTAADLVFDATGFPRSLGEGQILLHDIPTNAALVCRGPATTFQAETRAVARPHGWVFVIPLTTSTSYGYIYNADVSHDDEVRTDFARFLQKEGIGELPQLRLLRFPSFVQRQLFDGALFRVGNAASFLEPLEATAIAVTLEELRLASLWLGDGLLGARGEEKWNPQVLDLLNEHLIGTVQAIALFVGWHYACGSRYDTPFWRFAQTNHEESLSRHAGAGLLTDLQRFVQAGTQVPDSQLEHIRDTQIYEQEVRPNLAIDGEMGGFGVLSFAQIGHGIGAYPDAAMEEVQPDGRGARR
jgi:tryptophan halogenase